MKIYLDNCCFNRPYDDQTQIRISLETQAKLYVQDLVKNKKLDPVTSYVLWYENGQNPIQMLNPIDFIRRLEGDLYGQ